MKPNLGRALSAVGAVLLAVSLALVWYHIDRPASQGSTTSTGWETFPRLRVVLAAGAVVTLASAAVPQRRLVLLGRTALGVVLAALILRRIVDPPSISAPLHTGVGVYVGFIAALFVALGGLVDTGREVATGGLGIGRPVAALPPGDRGGQGAAVRVRNHAERT
jgi:hypothetical protein